MEDTTEDETYGVHGLVIQTDQRYPNRKVKASGSKDSTDLLLPCSSLPSFLSPPPIFLVSRGWFLIPGFNQLKDDS